MIPGDCWHDPYMTRDGLEREIASGVTFWGHAADDTLATAHELGDLTSLVA